MRGSPLLRARAWALALSTASAALAIGGALAPNAAHAAPTSEGVPPEPGETEVERFYDPRLRRLPRKHRFRMGLQLQYMRMSAALDEDTGEVQRFHFVPLQLDFAYQARLGRFMMIRPSLAIGGNVGNTIEAMPLVIQPTLFGGYQGRLVGVAIGYGFVGVPVRTKDAVSEARGGLGQPVISNAHQIGGELSFTTRVHKRRESAPGAGEFSIIVRVSGVTARTQHFDIDNRRWRALLTFNLGWYFGDGRRKRARAAER